MRAVVFSCAHVGPNQDLSRFLLLSKFIVDQQPEYVISLGDLVTLESLSSWDSSKPREMEGKRYAEDVKAGRTAISFLRSEVVLGNMQARDQKRKQYKPSFIFINGNHEYRSDRYLDKNPVMEDKVNLVRDLGLQSFECVSIDYKDDYHLGGVSFKHCFIGDNGKGISRANVENYAIEQSGTSVVFGHHHFLRYKSKQRCNVPPVQTLCVGTFSEHRDAYLDGADPDVWRGFILLDIYDEGVYDFDTWSIRRLRSEYE